jgi:hypothetical protein
MLAGQSGPNREKIEMGSPLMIVVGADKGVGKTTVTRALRDYIEAPPFKDFPAPRLLDGQFPRGDLSQFHPDAEVINVTDIQDQMKLFDNMQGVTLVDLPAGVLGFMLKACDKARLLDDVRDGSLRLALLHVLGPSLSSMDEIAEATTLLGAAAKHFIVKNYINETKFFEWDQESKYTKSLQALEPVTISIPHLETTCGEAVQQNKCSFINFIKPGPDVTGKDKSRTLRGITANWLADCAAGFDKVGLGRMIEETFR